MKSPKEITTHPYFIGINWNILRQYPAPFIPNLESDIDAGYFDDFEDELAKDKYKEVYERISLVRKRDGKKEVEQMDFRAITFRFLSPRSQASLNSFLRRAGSSLSPPPESTLVDMLPPFGTIF